MKFAVNCNEWPARLHRAGCAHLRLVDPGAVFTTLEVAAGSADEVVDEVVRAESEFFGESRPTFAPCVPKALRS